MNFILFKRISDVTGLIAALTFAKRKSAELSIYICAYMYIFDYK